MDQDEQRECIRRYKAGDQSAGVALLKQYEQYVKSIARRYVRPGSMDWEDILQVGRMGVLKGCLRFDLSHTSTVLTYIAYWVLHHIKRTCIDEGSVVRIPAYQYDKKIAEEAKRTARNVRKRHVYTFSEMADRMNEDLDHSFEETLQDDGPLVEEVIGDVELEQRKCDVVDRMLRSLNPRIRDMINRRYQEEPEHLATIAKRYGISRERARQIVTNYVTKMAENLKVDRQQAFDLWAADVSHKIDELMPPLHE